MQTQSTLFDDLSKLMTNAAGMAQGMRDEAETAMRSAFERWLRESSLVTEEEFAAVREMATKAREENAALMARIEALEAKLAAMSGAAGKAKPK
ncbi:MAG: accessory factor UbiK family protein [Pseudomonadota bacterium]